MMHLMITAEL